MSVCYYHSFQKRGITDFTGFSIRVNSFVSQETQLGIQVSQVMKFIVGLVWWEVGFQTKNPLRLSLSPFR